MRSEFLSENHGGTCELHCASYAVPTAQTHRPLGRYPSRTMFDGCPDVGLIIPLTDYLPTRGDYSR